MNLRKIKPFLGILILLAYIGIGAFGLFQFSHMSGTPMPNCPYAENGYAICKDSLSHINTWQQFSNIIFSPLFVFSFLILGAVLFFLDKRNLLNHKQHFYIWKYYLYDKKSYSCSQEIIKWLSLFENSPSLSYVRHRWLFCRKIFSHVFKIPFWDFLLFYLILIAKNLWTK